MAYVFIFLSALYFHGEEIQNPAHEVRINFVGKKLKGGKVSVAVYDHEDAFPVFGKHRFAKRVSVEEALSNGMSFSEVPSGTYAIAAFCDENENGTLDRNVFGVPTEPYGFSKVPPSKWKDPVFKDVAVEVTSSNTNITIQLKKWKDYD